MKKNIEKSKEDKLNEPDKKIDKEIINKPKDPIKHHYRKYKNEELYPSVTNHYDINSNIINIVDVQGDVNCLYWEISRFVFGTEDLHLQN